MFTAMINRKPLLFAVMPALAGVLLSSAGCKAPQAFGERDSIIVRADPELWAQVDSVVMDTLEQRAFTTRPERIFSVTYVASDDTLWQQLRVWQQVLVIGTRDDETVARLVAPDVAAPAVVHTSDVWAGGQLVSVMLLPPQNQAEAALSLLPDLYSQLRARYDEWIVERMYTTGVNDSLVNALAAYGFTLQLPKVYIFSQKDSLFRFGNPYRQAESDVLRSLLLTWRSGTEPLTAEALRSWREAIDEAEYEPPQDILDEGLRADSFAAAALSGLELRGVWQDRSDFPAAGPFITRAIACPEQNRTYYIDAWLFAPGKDKYPYLRQLEVLLDSFRCVD